MHQYIKFILKGNSTCFGQFLCPSSSLVYYKKFVTMHGHINVKKDTICSPE